MLRRILAMVLTLCMIILLACGCTSSKNNTGSGNADQQKSADITQAKTEASTSAGTVENASKYPITKEKITVKAMIIPGTLANDDNKKLLWDCVEELTNIHLEPVTIEAEQKSVYLASGDWPDFFYTPLGNSEINSYGVEGKMLVNYKDYLEDMPNLAACFEKYPTSRKVVTKTDGAIYQLPMVNIASTSTTARPHYREDVLNELGLKVPTTTDEFHDVLAAIKKAKGIAPIVADMNGGYEFFLFAAFGEATNCGGPAANTAGSVINPGFDSIDGKTVLYTRTTDQYRHYLEYVSQLYSEGLLYKEFLTLNRATMDAMAQEGTSIFSNNLTTLTAKSFKSGKVEVGTLAPLTSQYSSTQKIIGSSNITVSGCAINKNSKYIKEICRMLDIAFAEEEVAEGTGLYGKAFAYGPEGMTWEYKDDQKTSFDFIVPKDMNVTATAYIAKYVKWSTIGLFDSMMITAEEGNPRARQMGYVKNEIPYQREFFPYALLPFTSDEQSVIDAKLTDIHKYACEMRGKFITGVADIKTGWDEYITTINKMGIDDVLKVYQAAYDRWNKL